MNGLEGFFYEKIKFDVDALGGGGGEKEELVDI